MGDQVSVWSLSIDGIFPPGNIKRRVTPGWLLLACIINFTVKNQVGYDRRFGRFPAIIRNNNLLGPVLVGNVKLRDKSWRAIRSCPELWRIVKSVSQNSPDHIL